MRKAALALSILVAAAAAAAAQASPPGAASISVELGGGAWIGDFREHLERDGAYLATPSLDFVARLPIDDHWGIEAIVGSACVIHRYSEPIDGSFFYQEAGLYGGIQLGGAFAWVAAEVGFEHGTLRVSEYSSGIAGASIGIEIPLGGRLSWRSTLRLRRGFLQAVTLAAAYDLDEIDHPTSVTASTGIAYSL